MFQNRLLNDAHSISDIKRPWFQKDIGYRIRVLLNMILKVVHGKIMDRNAVQVPVTNGKVIVQITP